MRSIEHYWQTINPISLLLSPLSGVFYLLVALRRALYRYGVLNAVRLPAPVIVVGNISVGGSGKSPLVVWMARHLRERGYRPGIISRGHGGASSTWPQLVNAGSNPAQVGDEPVMIARQTGCPVCVAPDRVAAAQMLLAEHDCDLLIADDGLQHYRLQRDLEIALIDGQRRHGNSLLLPAGPLREPVSRLREVTWRISKGKGRPGEMVMEYRLGDAVSLSDPAECRPLAAFVGRPVHALAGIGNPASFFERLEGEGLTVVEHPFADHHPFTAADIEFDDDNPVLMTHKDAVKCESLASARHWFVPLLAELPADFAGQFDQAVAGLLMSNHSTGVADG